MLVFLSKAWVWIKNYWYIPFILGLAAAAFLLKKKDIVDWSAMLDNARNSHKSEVGAIEAAHAKEIALRNAALKRVAEAKEKIKEEYKRNEIEIDAKKEKEIDRVLKQTKNDPDAMAEEIKKKTGFNVIIVD